MLVNSQRFCCWPLVRDLFPDRPDYPFIACTVLKAATKLYVISTHSHKCRTNDLKGYKPVVNSRLSLNSHKELYVMTKLV